MGNQACMRSDADVHSAGARALYVNLIWVEPSIPTSRDEVTINAYVYGGDVSSVTLKLTGNVNKTMAMTGSGENYTAKVGRLPAGAYDVEVTATNSTGGSASSEKTISIATISISLSDTLVMGDYVTGKGYKPGSYLKVTGQIRVLTERNGSAMEVFAKVGNGSASTGVVNPNGTYSVSLALPTIAGQYKLVVTARCTITGETEDSTQNIKVASSSSSSGGGGGCIAVVLAICMMCGPVPLLVRYAKKAGARGWNRR